ncbi:MAG: hypothetical protein J4472_00105 [DPANN group archaeon]|nr:hypothetical protein [DPANN group archaeon]
MAKTSKLAKLEKDVENIWKELKLLSEQSVKQENLHRKFLKELAQKVEDSRQHTQTSNKEVIKLNKNIRNFAEKAEGVESKYLEAKHATAELEDTARIFVKQFDSLNDKTNLHVNKLADLLTQVEAMEGKMARLEQAPDKLKDVQTKVSGHEARLTEIRDAIETIQQFRNKYGRTIILD